MGADIRAFENRLDQVTDQINKISKAVIPFIEKQRDLINAGKQGTTELRQATERLDSFADQMKALQGEHNKLRAAIDAGNLRRQDAQVSSRIKALSGDSLISALKDHKGFDHFVRSVSDQSNAQASSGKINLGSFFRPGVDYLPGQVRQGDPSVDRKLRHLRASLLDTTTTAPIVTPEYDETILMQPRQVNVLTQLIGSRRTSATNKVIRYREAQKPSAGAVTTAAAVATDTTLTLDRVDFLTTSYPFNRVKIGDETLVISAINTSTNVITFTTTPLANPYDAGTNVFFTAITQTNEGVLKPSIVGDLEPYEIPLVKFSAFRKMTTEALSDITGISQYIDTMGPLLIGEQREVNMLYGPGGSDTAMTGLFVDANVPAALPWSNAAFAGYNLWDYITYLFYEGAKRSVMMNSVLMSVDRHRDLSQLAGTDGHYIWNINNPEGAPRMAFVGEILWSPWLLDEDIMLGDFQTACTIYEREAASVQFGLDGNDFTENKMTARFEERAGLGIELPLFLQKGTADNAPP